MSDWLIVGFDFFSTFTQITVAMTVIFSRCEGSLSSVQYKVLRGQAGVLGSQVVGKDDFERRSLLLHSAAGAEVHQVQTKVKLYLFCSATKYVQTEFIFQNGRF